MQYHSAKETATRWNISQRRVAILCAEGRVPDAAMVGNMWIIPEDAVKPIDGRTVRCASEKSPVLKPFVKWAGGKGQLLSTMREAYPAELGKTITKYAEPFVGGGAVLFDILSQFSLDSVYISDINAELINTYTVIRDDVEALIEQLEALQHDYVPMDTEERKKFYYNKRDRFNALKLRGAVNDNVEQAALFVFLNKTCFNGLYRVNRSGMFNVPMGAYKNPCISDTENLMNVSHALQNVTIVCADYRQSADFIDNHTFAYFDPPYRPLTATSGFTSYMEDVFDDVAQSSLAEFISKMDMAGAKVVASNSDPKNADTDDDFFDVLYQKHRIRRIQATRMINCKSEFRGKISELLISNC